MPTSGRDMLISAELEKIMSEIVMFGRKMLEDGLTAGSGGNLSVFIRNMNIIAITPSGLGYKEMNHDDVVLLDGNGRPIRPGLKPSSELGFHIAAYKARPDVSALVHTHSPYATTFACLRKEIPAVHYLVGFAGKKVPVAPYATFGSDELASSVGEYISDSNALLLANHGLVAIGNDIAAAYNVALEVEFTARIFHQALAIGKPYILDDDEMGKIIKKFETYGKPSVA